MADATPEPVACARCKGGVSSRTPTAGVTQRIGLTKTTVAWRLRFSRFHWRWLPKNPHDRVSESFTTLDLCDWCAGDVFLFAQGLPPRATAWPRQTTASSAVTTPDRKGSAGE